MGVLSWDWHEREIRVDVRPRGWEPPIGPHLGPAPTHLREYPGLPIIVGRRGERPRGGARPGTRAENQTMRPTDSSYDRSMGDATTDLLAALRSAGHTVETPVTGSVIVDGDEITSEEWDLLAVAYDGDLEALGFEAPAGCEASCAELLVETSDGWASIVS